MKKNMGPKDKSIRMLLVIVFVVLYFMEVVTGTLGIVLVVLSGVLWLTTFLNFCPLYLPFGINTNKKD